MPYKPEHLDQVRRHAYEKQVGTAEERQRASLAHAEGGPAYTAFQDGEPIACGGIMILWKHVGEAWFAMRYDKPDIVIPIFRTVKKYLGFLMELHNLKRVQVLVRADWPESIRFSQKLGFEAEALLRKFTPDLKDCFILSKVVSYV